MKVHEYLPNLASKPRFDLMHWNVSIGPDKWPIFGRFLTLFPLKHPARREKIPPIWQTSLQVLYKSEEYKGVCDILQATCRNTAICIK
jgi:hypothetical protein